MHRNRSACLFKDLANGGPLKSLTSIKAATRHDPKRPLAQRLFSATEENAPQIVDDDNPGRLPHWLD